MSNFVSLRDLDLATIDSLLDESEQLLGKGARGDELASSIVANLFFEPSTRTRLSFETAALRLGAQVIGFADARTSSDAKGETLSDTIRVVEHYADAIVLRHPTEGAAALAAEVCAVPIINAGDGANEHPTQTLIDLFTIRRRLGTLSDLRIGFIGDVRYSRSVRSLAQMMSQFGGSQVWIAPQDLQPEGLIDAPNVVSDRVDKLSDVISSLDVLYVQRPQKERWPDGLDVEIEVVDAAALNTAKDSLVIMNPLPRTYELATDVDLLPQAAYFEQVANSVPVRMAVLKWCLDQV